MTQQGIPEQMTVVVLDSYSGAEALRVEQRPVPKPGKDEVLVKIAASPINPSDLAVLTGHYGYKNLPPLIPGGEASGTVVAVGPGLMGRYFLGKQVACLSQGDTGVWAEYVVTTTKGGVFPLNKGVSLEQGAMSIINPLTASAFLQIIKQGGHKAIVLTAAASSVGQMIARSCQSAGIKVIRIVRRDAQVEMLKQRGSAIVLNSSDSDFCQRLHDICHQNQVHLALDAVAGSLTAQLLEALPPHSKVTVYGGLSEQAPQASLDQIIFQSKAIDGFWLVPWIEKKNLLQILLLWRRAQKLLGTDLKTEIRERYPFEDARQAVEDYQNHMTGGKVLLVPN